MDDHFVEIFPIWPTITFKINLKDIVGIYVDPETRFTWLKFHNGDIEHVCLGSINENNLNDFEKEIGYKFQLN